MKQYDYMCTIGLDYDDYLKLLKVLELLNIKDGEDLHNAFASMLMMTVDELLAEKDKEKLAKKKHSIWRYLTPVTGGINMLHDLTELRNKVDENDE